ncbi:hypothetical protein [Thermoactinomyces sp. CICC 10522]|jgi:hypothetical protein|uniref:hypothetical protein n=1 Tax=Thermoactinomyces sp. CICC 10522 TaxID=2767427 RepID=UPI0018DE3BDC|nr:hypothetical protein [Thermoactinomyces sp. CICC 10522]MBH8605340.1 hypothetical protein [Thermoactinomyces sp. CICC 10522]
MKLNGDKSLILAKRMDEVLLDLQQNRSVGRQSDVKHDFLQTDHERLIIENQEVE